MQQMQPTQPTQQTIPIAYPVITAIFIAVTFGVFAPLELFFTNINDVWFDIYDILPPIAIITAVIALITAAILTMITAINRKAGKIASIAVSIACVSLYIQGNFLQASYDKLGTETIDWSKYTAEGVSNVCGWVGMLAIFAIMLYKLHLDGFIKVFKTVMICIMLIQLTTLTVVSIARHGFMHKDEYVATEEDETVLSSDTNFIVLVLDTYDSRLFDDLLQTDRADEYKNILEDFTFYRNTLTVFTLTDFSIPQILTGEKYLNQEDYGPYIDRAYAESPFLNRLHNDNYDMDIYTTVTLPQSNVREWMGNWHKVDYASDDTPALMCMFYRLVAFKYAPHYLKAPFEFDIDKLDDVREVGVMDGHEWTEGTDPDVFSWSNSNIHFIDTIPGIEASDTGKKFRFYHIKGVHHTRELDEHLNEVDDLGDDGDGVPLEESAKANMAIVGRFLNRLKEIGAYDDSVIVIMSDHGAVGYSGGGMIQAPLLLIKGREEKHEFKVSEAPVSYEDMQDAFMALLDDKTGEDVFTVKEGDERVRTMYYTGFIGQRRRFTRNEAFIEYSTKAHAYDNLRLLMTHNEY